MIIKATNDSGTIIIKAESGLERIYEWIGGRAKVKLIPRKERWYGSLGIYNPGGGGRIHTVVEEGEQYFCSEKEALEWLSWKDERMHYVYTSDGIVVGWYTDADPNSTQIALSVELWQFYVLGKKPRGLSGARNDLVLVSYSNESPSTSRPADRFLPSKPKIIGGRLYSGKSLDYMKEREMAPTDVEDVISNGKIIQHGAYTTYIRLDDPFDILWVKIDKDGRVVLVGR